VICGDMMDQIGFGFMDQIQQMSMPPMEQEVFNTKIIFLERDIVQQHGDLHLINFIYLEEKVIHHQNLVMVHSLSLIVLAVGYLCDLWRFDGTYWTWISGSALRNQYGIYGTKCVKNGD
jgi:hypothetical protein